MQLAFRAPTGAAPTTVVVKKVELLDAKGKLLQVLTARAPTHFSAGQYRGWDGRLASGDRVAAKYALSAPRWDQLTNGRWNAHTKTFQLRVTVTLGSATRTIDKQAITPARLPPPVPT